mgnify:FL=1
MKKTKKANFPPEFRLETAQLVVDNGRTLKDVSDTMGVSYSTYSGK